MKLSHIREKAGKALLIHLLAWLCYSLLMLGLNRMAPGSSVGVREVLGVNLLIIPLFYGLVGILWLMVFYQRWWLGWILLVAGVPLVMALAYAHVYYLLPALGVVLYWPDVPFTWAEFSKVILAQYLRMAAYAAFYVWYMRARRLEEAKRQAGAVVRPLTIGRLARVIYRAFTGNTDMLDPNDYIVLHDVEAQVNTRAFLTEIHYMEAQKNDTVFHLSNGFSIRIRKGIDTVEELLPEKHFIRVHRSFIVAERLAYRREKRSEILLRGVAHSIPVGPKYQDEVDRLFLE